MTIDKSGNLKKGYTDTVESFSGDISGITGAQDNSQILRIGASGNGRWYNGQIDDVMIFDRALSESEIQDIYDAQKPAGHGTMIEPSEDQLALNNLASILSAIQGILEKLKSLF